VTYSHKDQPSRIAAEYLQIQHKFASLLSLGRRKLQGKIIDMQNFRLFLVQFYSPEDYSNDSRAVNASDFVDKVLGTAQDLSDVLLALTKRGMLNCKNYFILHSIINNYASDDHELMEETRKYNEELARYTRVTNVQDYVDAESQQDQQSEADPELFSVLSLKLRENVRDHTLQYVKDVWDSLAHQLKLPHSTLLFERVADGCLEIIWTIPSHLNNFIIRQTQENIEYFQDQQVLRVTIANKCIYEGEAPTPDDVNEGKKDSNWRKVQ